MPLDTKGLMLVAQINEAFQNKENLNEFWQDTAENFYPERADFTIDKTLGEDFAAKVYASDPIIFRRDFGNWIGAAIRPKGRDWFMPTARDDQIAEMISVRKYLEQRGRTTRKLLYDRKSQFVRAMREADHDYVTFGNSVTSVEERQDKSGFLYRTWHLRDCAWRESHEGEVNCMFRKFRNSVRQLCARKGMGWKISPKVEEKRAQNGGALVNCVHALLPTVEYDYERKKVRHPFISLYIDLDNGEVMSEKEVAIFNYAVSRWFTMNGSPFAFSPAVCASIPDGRTMQTMTWSIMEAGEKMVEPPLIAQWEAIQGGVNFSAGSITWADKNYDERTGEVLRALELGGNPELGEALRQTMRSNMMEAWYLNKLYLPQDTGAEKRTAAEIARIEADFLRATQPIVDPAEQERNGPVLDITIAMCVSMGYWGPVSEMPRELRGQDVDLTYDNPIEDARRRAKTNAWRETMELVQVQAGIDPKPIAQLDQDQAFRDAIAGVAPPDWLLSEDDAEGAIQQADKAQTADKVLGEVATVADAAGKVMPKGQQPAAPSGGTPQLLQPVAA